MSFVAKGPRRESEEETFCGDAHKETVGGTEEAGDFFGKNESNSAERLERLVVPAAIVAEAES